MAGSRKDRPWFLRRGARRPLATGRNRRRPRVEELEAYILLSTTFTVTNSNDDGSMGTLSWAIGQVNGDTSDSSASPDTIAFNIPKAAAWTISEPNGLPTISNPVVINGNTQPGIRVNVREAIQIDGSGSGGNGLTLGPGSDDSSVLGLSITDFSGDGILIESSSNTIADDNIGVDMIGYTVESNGGDGVFIDNAADNIIGGNQLLDDLNVISGNTANGVEIEGSSATDNAVEGNYIGLDFSGEVAAGNGTVANFASGVQIGDGASYNYVGVVTPLGEAGLFNAISGNVGSGISIDGTGTSHNVVTGNYIGTDATGTMILTSGNTPTPLGNGNGIDIFAAATDNTIGGTVTGDANVISGNVVNASAPSDGLGIIIQQAGTDDNLVEGNDIGTDATGTVALGNSTGGVQVATSATGNTIGGSSAGAANTIGGNGSDGADISEASSNTIQGNYVGTNAAGDTGLGNGDSGVSLYNGAADNRISGNTIDDNGANRFGGITIAGSGASDNVVTGNTISGNAYDGVDIFLAADGNTIGGVTTDANTITSNGLRGVYISDTGTSDNVVAGDLIANNTYDGVDILGGATGNTIGGSTTDANTITNNGFGGVNISDSGTSDNVVAGDYIGTDANGDTGLGNALVGVTIDGGATDNTVGGTAGAINVIAGNLGGVAIENSGTTGNVVEGNFIGTDAAGDTDLSNFLGVQILGGASANTIGGTTAGAGNTIEDNGYDGVALTGPATSGNLVAGNTISFNGNEGVAVSDSSSGGPTGNRIGGSSSGYGNDISGNQGAGIYVYGSGVSLNLIAANTITDNTGDGVDISSSSSGGPTGNIIGGTSGGSANIITSNGGNGIYISGSATTGNLVIGNFIGTDASDDTGLGNAISGVRIDSAATDNTISDNVIASNAEDGVTIFGDASDNLVEDNFLGTDPAGDPGLGNGDSGVVMFGGAFSNTITGNTISDNGANGYGGVNISGANDNLVTANTISGNAYDGVDIFGGAEGNTIGGIQPGDANIIVSNTWGGVDISGSGTSDNVVVGNFIGTNFSDATGLGNGLVGVTIFDGATDNTIGGAPVVVAEAFHPDTFAISYANVIVSNGAGGVDIEDSGTTGNVVEGNYIGTDAAGDTGLGNILNGVEILGGASGNSIGGTGFDAGNTIAANTSAGVDITDSGTSDNVVEGNFIGTNAASATNLGNSGAGVVVQNGATTTTIGGVANVIAGNHDDGIALLGPGTSGVTIENNYIGTDSVGDTGLGNAFWGVYVDDVANVVVGAAGAGNVVSGNDQGGVTFRGISSVNESIQANLIGVAPNGTSALGNSYSGVLIGDWGVSGDFPSDVTIGGTTSVTGNIISANGEWGVWISGASVTGVVVEGNTIGTDADSDTGLGNALSGVQIDSGATMNTIGGTTAGAGNLIANNGDLGVEISGTGTSENVVEGNNVGLNAAQSAGLGNTYGGVSIINGATNNTVGGTSSAAANVITGNGTASTASITYANLAIYDTGTTGNVAEGNFIGTTASSASGLNALSDDGVFLGYGATGNTIGGSTAAARNIISGNTEVGVVVDDGGPAGNTIEGNYVGTNVGGNAALANSFTGVLIESDGTSGEPSTNNLVIDNVLSGNGESGVAIENASENTIEDNLIGVGANGTSDVANGWDGVHLELVQGSPPIGTGAADNTIVGNTIDFNDLYGVLIEYAGSTGNSVQGNSIGTVGGNVLGGIMLDLGANGNSIGGTTANVISGNGGPGITISGTGTSDNLVTGNFIGTTSGGTGGLGNAGDGVTITAGATANTIGGTTAAEANTIADNTGNGVTISSSGTTGNVVEGNWIGTNSAGATNLGNSGDGVEVFNSASGNSIGGTVAGAGNVIDDNSKGVVIGSSLTDTAIHDAILGNSIYGNTKLGIDLGNDGVTPNDSAGHSGPNLLQDFPVITEAYTVGSTTTITGTVSGPANSTLRVELFSNPAADPSGYGQGKVFLGYVTVTTNASGGGLFIFSPSSSVAVGQFISAAATDVNGDTSEFAQDAKVSATAPLNIGYAITGPLYNPIKKVYTETVTLTNDGASAVHGFEFLLENLTPGVTLTNATGTASNGSPYITVNTTLNPNQSTTVTLTFSKTSSSLYINYTPMFEPLS